MGEISLGSNIQVQILLIWNSAASNRLGQSWHGSRIYITTNLGTIDRLLPNGTGFEKSFLRDPIWHPVVAVRSCLEHQSTGLIDPNQVALANRVYWHGAAVFLFHTLPATQGRVGRSGHQAHTACMSYTYVYNNVLQIVNIVDPDSRAVRMRRKT